MYRQPGSAMGKAGRDPPVTIPVGATAREGNNRLLVQCQDQRSFSVLIRVVQRRTLQEVRDMVPPVASLPMSQKFLQLTLGGGGRGDDSDDDIMVQDNAVLSLRCPISGLVCKTPARTRNCRGMAVFDLDTYLELNSKVRKWTCPHCGVAGRPNDIIIDGYLTRILGVLRVQESDVSRVEVEPNGRWRPCLEEGASVGSAVWIPADIMEGVLLREDGSVLKVTPQLMEKVGALQGSATKVKEEHLIDDNDEGSDGEETDEDEEWRRAVAEAIEGREQATSTAQKSTAVEVICISDSDDDEPTPSAPQPAPTADPPPTDQLEGNRRIPSRDGRFVDSAPRSRQQLSGLGRGPASDADRQAAAAAAVAAASTSAALAAAAAAQAATSAAAASFQASQAQRLNSPRAYAAATAAYYESRESAGGVAAWQSQSQSQSQNAPDGPPATSETAPSNPSNSALLLAQQALDTTRELLRQGGHGRGTDRDEVSHGAVESGEVGGVARVSTETARRVLSPADVAAGTSTQGATGCGAQRTPPPKLVFRMRRPSQAGEDQGAAQGEATKESQGGRGEVWGAGPGATANGRGRAVSLANGNAPAGHVDPSPSAAASQQHDHLDELINRWFDPESTRDGGGGGADVQPDVAFSSALGGLVTAALDTNGVETETDSDVVVLSGSPSQ